MMVAGARPRRMRIAALLLAFHQLLALSATQTPPPSRSSPNLVPPSPSNAPILPGASSQADLTITTVAGTSSATRVPPPSKVNAITVDPLKQADAAVLPRSPSQWMQGQDIEPNPKPLVRKRAIEFTPSVSTFYLWDFISFAEEDGSNVCIEQVKRAAAFNNKKVNFVITWFFRDNDGDAVPDSWCYRLHSDSDCLPFDRGVVNTFKRGIQACFAKAVELGLDIAITPHVNDGGPKATWRNALKLNPLQQHEGWSYTGMLIRPMVEALAAVAKPGMKIWFCMQGEMNLSVMMYPGQYTQMYQYIKDVLYKGRTGKPFDVSVGVCLNFNKLLGMDYLEKPADLEGYNVPRIVQLLNTVDHVGISNYPSVYPVNSDYSQLESAMRQLDRELHVMDVSLLKLTKRRHLLLNEFGFGGGIDQNGGVPARTGEQVGKYSYFGIFGPYRRLLDPWRTWQPESVDVPTRTFIRQVYQMTANYLKAGGLNYRVDAMFLWGCASWDQLGVHPGSYSEQGSYREKGVVSVVSQHNAAVNEMPLPAGAAKVLPNGTFVESASMATP